MVDLLNKQVMHSGAFGIGTVTKQDDKYITVQFASKVSKFDYPAAFEKYLVVVDPVDADAISKEIEEAKVEAEAVKAAEVAKKATEEQAKLEVLKTKSITSGKKSKYIKDVYTSKACDRSIHDIPGFPG